MIATDKFQIAWEPREFPLVPLAAAAQGEASVRLAQRLLQLNDEDLSQLEGVAGRELLLLRGRTEILPWVEGVQYLGVDPESPGLLLPTNYRPKLPAALVQVALSAHIKDEGGIAVLPLGSLLVSLRNARPVVRSTLLAWLERR